MTQKRNIGKLPLLKTDKEIDRFWSSHDFTDYEDEFEPVREKTVLSPKLAKKIRERSRKKHLIAVRLDDEQYTYAQKLAFSKSLGLSTLIRTWIVEALRREMQPTS